MKIIAPKLRHLLNSEVTTLATCWHLRLKSGKEMGFTDFDQDLNINDVIYNSASGFTPGAILNNSGVAVDNLEIEGMLDHELISKQDILAGCYDHAEIEIFMIDYENINLGKIPLKRGWFGEVVMKGEVFAVEIRGLTQALDQNIGDLYAPKCRAKFGDAKCKASLVDYTFSGSLSEVHSNNVMIDINRKERAGFFRYGSITFITGANAGISGEIQDFNNGRITLSSPLPYSPQVKDRYEIIAGCDKSFATCIERYNNAVNFRGEPHLPGFMKLITH